MKRALPARFIVVFLLIALGAAGIIKLFSFVASGAREKEVLKKIIRRLEADTRIAQVLVTDVRTDFESGKVLTTIKFLEYDAQNKPLPPRYFTFSGNVIQFQSLVVRFKDLYVERGDPVKGRSAYLFLKVFFLDGPNTQVYDITKSFEVPKGYKIEPTQEFSLKAEEAFWGKFWEIALDPQLAQKAGVKTAQIEAPGTKFVPGALYTIRIEHDGGIRIDVEPLPDILKGERILPS